jgi:hypothetical protein
VFCTQLHHAASVRQARALVARIQNAGYHLVANVPAVKLTFVREFEQPHPPEPTP